MLSIVESQDLVIDLLPGLRSTSTTRKTTQIILMPVSMIVDYGGQWMRGVSYQLTLGLVLRCTLLRKMLASLHPLASFEDSLIMPYSSAVVTRALATKTNGTRPYDYLVLAVTVSKTSLRTLTTPNLLCATVASQTSSLTLVVQLACVFKADPITPVRHSPQIYLIHA